MRVPKQRSRQSRGLPESELGRGFEGVGRELVGEEFWPGGGGDHGGVVRGESDGGEGEGEIAAGGFGGEAAAKLGVSGDSSADEQAAGAEVLDGQECGAGEIVRDGGLEAGDQVEGFGVEMGEGSGEGFGIGRLGVDEVRDTEGVGTGFDAVVHSVEFGVAADGRLDAAEGEVEAGGVVAEGECGFSREFGGGVAAGLRLDLREGEGDGLGVAVGSEGIHPGASGVGKSEEFGDLVEGLAGRVVEGLADVAIVPGVLRRAGGEIEVGVASADDEREEGVGVGEGSVHEDGVDVAFEVVDGDEREVGSEGERLGKADADKQGSGEAWAFGDGDGGKVGVADAGALHGFADDGDDGA